MFLVYYPVSIKVHDALIGVGCNKGTNLLRSWQCPHRLFVQTFFDDVCVRQVDHLEGHQVIQRLLKRQDSSSAAIYAWRTCVSGSRLAFAMFVTSRSTSEKKAMV